SANVAVGDFVTVGGNLGEVSEILTTKYGLTSYRIKYLAERPKPGVPEDWFTAIQVRKVYSRSDYLSGLDSMVQRGIIPQELAQRMRDLPESEKTEVLRASLLDLWKKGLRGWVGG
ncbi:MAG TPA: hypothetical protein VG712_03255, partial [Gemmatimonadales bacterium]|nr:hypothetical protein [Gemmatimonadales bacterium]